MRILKTLGRTLAAATLFVGGALVLPGPGAYAADTDPVTTIFFGRELMAFMCVTHGGTYYESGTGYGCHLAGGGDVFCDNGVCTWYPVFLTATGQNIIAQNSGLLQEISGADPFPGEVVNGHQQVLAMDVAPGLTLAEIQAVATGTVKGNVGAITQVLAVHPTTSTLSAAQLDSLLSGQATKGAVLQSALAGPKPQTSLGATASRLKVSGQRVIVVQGPPADLRGAPTTAIIIVD